MEDRLTPGLYLDLGDASALSDVDPALAPTQRERLWRELEQSSDLAVGSHFPELQFGRVLTGNGRRWST